MWVPRWPTNGPDLRGNPIVSATPDVTHPIHHVASTVSITTLAPPLPNLGFIGPLYLIADSVFSWTTSGNIGAAPTATIVVGHGYGFVYDRVAGKWYQTR